MAATGDRIRRWPASGIAGINPPFIPVQPPGGLVGMRVFERTSLPMIGLNMASVPSRANRDYFAGFRHYVSCRNIELRVANTAELQRGVLWITAQTAEDESKLNVNEASGARAVKREQIEHHG